MQELVDEQEPSLLIPTGLGFLDDGLGGGMVGGEMYGLHSFTGGGSTTLGCMIAAEGALAEWKVSYPAPCKRRWCVVVTGQSAEEVGYYAFSYLAGVPFDDVFECRKNITEMHQDKLSATIDHVARYGPSDERARCVMAATVLKQAMTIVDGSSHTRDSYWHPTDLLQMSVAKSVGHPSSLAGLVVDGTHFFVDDYRRASKQPEHATPRLYREFLSGCRSLYGSHGCPVWVTHELRPALAKSPADEKLTHRDVKECKDLGNQLDACFVLGNGDLHGRFYLSCTKTPRAKPQPRIVRFDRAGVQEIVEDPTACIETSTARGWSPSSPVNIDNQTLEEMARLEAALEQELSWYHRSEHRVILVRADE